MDYTKGRNLYSESRSVAGYLNVYGNQISSMSSTKEHTSDWIPVEGIDAITIQAWVPNISSNQQTWIGYTFFTDKDLASHIGSRPAKYGAVGVDNLSYVNVAVPDTAKYVRVSYRKFNTGYVKVEYGSEATTWSPAPEDAVDIISEGGVEFMILARESITVSRAIDISSYTRYYLLQASTLNPPAKPTSANPGSNWVTTEPSYTSGSTNSLYFVDKTTFSDGTFSYSNVSLSTEYEAAKSAYNLAHTANTNAGAAQETADQALAQSVEYIVGTQTAATGSWKGVTQDATLKTGKTIAYKLPYAGSGNASLTLTLATGSQTAAIPVYLNNTRVTTHYPAASVIKMTYDGSAWRSDYYSVSNTNNYDRRLHNDNIKAAAAITASHLIAGTSAGYKNLAASLAFDLSYPILWASAAIASAASAKTTYEAYPAVNFSTSGTIESGAAAKMLYLKGTVSGNTFTTSASPFLTTVIPTAADGFYYIPLGVMTSATAGYFASSNRLFAYLNGAFQAVDTAAAGIAQTTQSDLAAHKNYFWHDSAGAHISDTPGSTSGKNVLITSNSVQLRNGSEILAEFKAEGIDFHSRLRLAHELIAGSYERESLGAMFESFDISRNLSILIEPGDTGQKTAPHWFPQMHLVVYPTAADSSVLQSEINMHADFVRMNCYNLHLNDYPVMPMYNYISKSVAVGNGNIKFYRIANMVWMYVTLKGPYSTGATNLGTIIPEEYRPAFDFWTPSSKCIDITTGASLTSSTEVVLLMQSTGAMRILSSASYDANWALLAIFSYPAMTDYPGYENLFYV